MAILDQIVNVNITLVAPTVAQEAFGVPLIIGPTVPTSGGIIQSYLDPDAMLTNGYTTSSPEFIYAQEMFDQAIQPTEFFVGQRQAAVAQVDTFMVGTLVVPGHTYEFTLNGVVISYVSQNGDTQQAILSALLAAIAAAFPVNDPVSGGVTGVGAGATLTLTSVTPGQGVSYSAIDADLTHANPTPNYGIANDLAAFEVINNNWYGIVMCSNADYDILQLAAAVESQLKIFIGASNDGAIATNATTDILSIMKGKSYKRSALVYSPLNYNQGIDAGWMGGQLPAVPGSNNWAFKTVVGALPDNISGNAFGIIVGNPEAGLSGKNGNVYMTIGGNNIMVMGQMAGGQYIDITIGLDWLQTTVQNNLFAALVSAQKIPYTDAGVTILMQAVRSAIDQGVVNGLIDGASQITVSAPPVLSVPITQRAARISPTISFQCRLQGAFNAVIVKGTVSV